MALPFKTPAEIGARFPGSVPGRCASSGLGSSSVFGFAGAASAGVVTAPSEVPEGAAATAAYDNLLKTGFLNPSDRVVLFNTGAGLKYTDVTAQAAGIQRMN